MAKSFGGFTPVQQKSLLSKMGYDGPAQQDDINKFMMASPRAAAMMGKYATLARGILEPSTRGFADGGTVAGITPWSTGEASGYQYKGVKYNTLKEAQAAEMAGNATGLQNPSTMPGSVPVTGAIQPTTTAMPTTTFDPSAYKKVSTVGGGSAYVDPNTKMVYNYSGSPYTGQVDIAGGGMYYNVADGVATEAGSKTQVPGGPGAARTYSTPGGQQVYFNAGDEKYYTASGQPYTGKVNTISGEQYDVTEGVNPAYTGVNAYDPTTGLPMPVGGTGDVDAYLEGTVTDFMKGGIKSIIESGNIPADPNKYEITGGPGNWTITFDNGQSFTSPNKNPASAENDAKMAAAALSGYTGGTETDLYQSQLGEYQQYQTGLAQQATADPLATLNSAQQNLADQQALLVQYNNELMNMSADDPRRASLMKLIEDQQLKINQASYGVEAAKSTVANVSIPSTDEARATAFTDPMSMVTQQEVAKFTPEQVAAGKIAEGTGQAPTAAATAATVKAAKAGDVVAPEAKAGATYDAEVVAAEVQATLDKLQAATGKPSAEALAEAQTMNPQDLAQLGLSAAQIEQAVQVQAPEARTIQEGELISGPTVDMGRVEEAVNFQAATGVPSTEATVQGQLTQLLSQFEGGETPPWAAGAMRAATATLAARGLAASSMAGQAVVQAAMESALPIAQIDAQTRAQFEAQNLSNRQQTAMFAAEQRAKFLGLEFDQAFQTRVANASKIADIANLNFTAEQQVALENARLTQSVDLANLSAANAKIMADAAAMTQVDLTGLNNRQQAAIQNAQSFLQMEMTNLSNEQQTAIFKAQGNIQSLITDAAAANAAAQFNATSENQANQFYDNLITQVAQFNNEQKNAMERFNADQANAIAQFNAAQQNARDQFNANNELVVAQANAQWDQMIATTENAAQNQANRDAALAATGMTESTYNNMLQQERDIMDYAWRTVDNALARDANLTIAEMQVQAEVDAAKGSALGGILGKVVSFALPKVFGAATGIPVG